MHAPLNCSATTSATRSGIAASGPVDESGEPAGTPFERRLKVVGVAVSPAVGLAGTDTPRLDEGILLASGAVSGRVFAYGSVVLFDVASGIGAEIVKERFPDGLPDDVSASTEWFESAKPAEVVQSQRSFEVLAFAVAAMLVGVLATIGLSLFSFVRERRAGFAVLKAIGFQPRQIRTAGAGSSRRRRCAAMLLALPAGTAAGRWLYQALRRRYRCRRRAGRLCPGFAHDGHRNTRSRGLRRPAACSRRPPRDRLQ